jgi:hypothetical protein
VSDLPPLGHLQGDPVDNPDGWAELRAIIEQAIAASPRSLQKRIGPSEIGTPCDRCLVHKLAGTPEAEQHAPWLPFVGTGVHAALEDIFRDANRDQPVRWLTETTVSVGQIGGVDITGHADLFDLHTGTVHDWKIVGATTLTKARIGPSATYRIQAHLYGLGFTRRGLRVNRVQINYLPRNSVHLGTAVAWSEPYDEQVARAALERANGFAIALDALGLDATLAALPPHTHEEFSCPRFPDGSQPSVSDAGRTTATLLNIA